MIRVALPLVLLLALSNRASAHGLDVTANVRGSSVAVTAYYDDDSPAAAAKVTVLAAAGNVIAEGTTDAEGTWSFPTPAAGEYRVKVKADDGHAASRRLTIHGTEAPGDRVTDGPSREAFAGPVRWAWAVVGVTVIAGLTFGLKRLLRRRPG